MGAGLQISKTTNCPTICFAFCLMLAWVGWGGSWELGLGVGPWLLAWDWDMHMSWDSDWDICEMGTVI
jgi:hypothetical protein